MEPVVTMTVLYWQYVAMGILSAFALTGIAVLSVGLIAIAIGSRNFRRRVFNEGVQLLGEMTKVEEELYLLEE